MDPTEAVRVLGEVAGALGAGGKQPAVAPIELTVAVSYTGPPDGVAYVTLTGGVARRVAAGMIGSTPSAVDDATVAEAALEFANIVVGNIMPLIYGSTWEFRLGSPRSSSAPTREGTAAASLRLGDGTIALTVVESA